MVIHHVLGMIELFIHHPYEPMSGILVSQWLASAGSATPVLGIVFPIVHLGRDGRKKSPRVCLGDIVDGLNPANQLIGTVVYLTVLFAWLKTSHCPGGTGFQSSPGLETVLWLSGGLRWWDVFALAARIFVVMEEWSRAEVAVPMALKMYSHDLKKTWA